MSILEALQAELKDATRARDQPRLEVIRAVKAELQMVVTAKGFDGEQDDDLLRDVMGRYVKKMTKARKEYETLGEVGAEMAEKLRFEVDYLGRWLPSKLDEEATRALVREAIAELGVSGPQQMGRVMGHLMKKRGADLDGALVNQLVRAELSSE